MSNSLDFSHANETNFAAMGIDYPLGRNAFENALLPAPPKANPDTRSPKAKDAQRRRDAAKRARESSKRKYAAKADARAFKQSHQLTAGALL